MAPKPKRASGATAGGQSRQRNGGVPSSNSSPKAGRPWPSYEPLFQKAGRTDVDIAEVVPRNTPRQH